MPRDRNIPGRKCGAGVTGAGRCEAAGGDRAPDSVVSTPSPSGYGVRPIPAGFRARGNVETSRGSVLRVVAR
jgi:hypothetical protein